MKALIDEGSDFNATDRLGNSACLIAAKNLNMAILKLLIHQGCDLKFADKSGNSALHVAAKRGASVSLLKLLIEGGSQLNAKNSAGETALTLCCAHNSLETVELLIASGADVNEGSQSVLSVALFSGQPSIVNYLIEHVPHLDLQKRDLLFGENAFFTATKSREISLMKYLAKNMPKFDVNAPRNDGRTALHIAVSNFIENAFEAIRYLVEDLSANLNSKDSVGETALYSTRHLSVLQYLIEHGADTKLKNQKGESVFTVISSRHNLFKDYSAMIAYLKKMGADK